MEMLVDCSMITQLRQIWSVLTGQVCRDKFCRGISALAVAHRCGVPFYSELKRRGMRKLIPEEDWVLLRGYAYYQRVRAVEVRSYIQGLQNSDITGTRWFVWKGAALLFLIKDYETKFEAADIDIKVAASDILFWFEKFQADEAEISKKRMCGDQLCSFQVRTTIQNKSDEFVIVCDVHSIEEFPKLVSVKGVYMPQKEFHLQMMEKHILKHQQEKEGCRLRMFYDAYLLDANWSLELCKNLLLNGGV